MLLAGFAYFTLLVLCLFLGNFTAIDRNIKDIWDIVWIHRNGTFILQFIRGRIVVYISKAGASLKVEKSAAELWPILNRKGQKSGRTSEKFVSFLLFSLIVGKSKKCYSFPFTQTKLVFFLKKR
jgi:hypothetical protein